METNNPFNLNFEGEGVWTGHRDVYDLTQIAERNRLLQLEENQSTQSKSGVQSITIPGSGGLPKSLISASVVESPSKQQGRTFSEVGVSFVRDGSDTNFGSVNIWFIGYKGSTTPTLMASGTTSPLTFLCESTLENVAVYVQPISALGVPLPLTYSTVVTVALDGVVSAPPAPSISQNLVGTPTGFQFTFNQVVLAAGTQDVIDSYRIYRNTTNSSGSASLIQTIKHSPTNSGAVVITDTITTATGSSYFYWVSAVNTAGLESTLTAAQSGTTQGSTGSIPATLNTPFTTALTTTTTTFTTRPSAFFTRADGTKVTIGQTTTAITGLPTNNMSYYFPYWRESDQSLQWVTASDVTIANITGATFTAASSQWVQTTTSAAIPATFSCEIWVKGTTAANQALFSYSNVQGSGAPASVEMQSFITSAGEVEFAIWNGAAWKTVTTAGASVLDGSWHHVVCSYDPSAASGTITIYVDSANTSDSITFWTTTSTGTISSTAGYWHIGFAGGFAGAPLTTDTFNSLTLSHAAVYSKALGVNDAGAHFQAYVNLDETTYAAEIAYDTAVSYWKLSEPSGSTATDSAGTNTGTYINAPTLNQTSPVITVLGSPQIAWPYVPITALQAQLLRNRTALSSGGIAAATTSSGSSSGSGGGSGGGYGGGGGGGVGGCFTGNTLVRTNDGRIPIYQFQKQLVKTAKGTWRPAILIAHESKLRLLHHMGNGEYVTHNHEILLDGRWIKAGLVYPDTVWIDAPIYTLSVLTGEQMELAHSPRTEHSFELDNGVMVTNAPIIK